MVVCRTEWVIVCSEAEQRGAGQDKGEDQEISPVWKVSSGG